MVAGVIKIDYEAICGKRIYLEMMTSINAKGDDIINIKETGHLNGEHAKRVLTSKVAVGEKSRDDVYNKIIASVSYSR
jgi:hypothetical protein